MSNNGNCSHIQVWSKYINVYKTHLKYVSQYLNQDKPTKQKNVNIQDIAVKW